MDKLKLRQLAIQGRLAELGVGEGTDEGKAEMDTLLVEYASNATRIQALIVSEGEPVETTTTRNEAKEKAELYRKASVGDLVYALVNGKSGVKGAMGELQQEYGLADNEIHIRQLAPETYAVTPGASEVGQDQQEIIPYVFPQACAAYLGVDMPTVAVGEAVFPVLTKKLDVRTPAENASADETTGSFSADVLSPSRIQASFFYSREDRARFMGMDESLRENLSMGLMDGLDAQIIAGTNGLLAGTNLPNNNVSAVTTFANYVSNFGYSRVDGRYASMTSDLKIVMGSDTFTHAGGVYRGSDSEETALDRLMRVTGGVKVSAHVTAAASNKQNNVIRLGMARDMVAPLWENVALIPDEVTKAALGQIVITAVMLHAVKILRTDGFHKQQIQTQ